MTCEACPCQCQKFTPHSVMVNFLSKWENGIPSDATKLHLPQVSLEWVLIGYIQFIMRSVLNLKRRTRETCKTRHSLIFTGHNNKISRGEGKRGCIAKMRICHGEYQTTDKYFNYRKKGYRLCEIGH